MTRLERVTSYAAAPEGVHGGWEQDGAGAMIDIEAIRERHRMTRRPEHRPEGVAAWERCALDEQDWPCDAARFMAETDRWREDAERLATVLRASSTDCALDDDERLCWVHGAPWPSLDDDCDWSSARARALAAHDEMKCDDEET